MPTAPDSAPWAQCHCNSEPSGLFKEPKDAAVQWAVSLPSLKHTHFCGKKHGWFLLRAMNKEWNFFSHKIQLRFCHQMSLLQTYQKKKLCSNL